MKETDADTSLINDIENELVMKQKIQEKRRSTKGAVALNNLKIAMKLVKKVDYES